MKKVFLFVKKWALAAWGWLTASNRLWHLAGGLVIGLASGGWWCALWAGGCTAGAMEFKDRQWGGKWDWTDFGLTLGGALMGRALMVMP